MTAASSWRYQRGTTLIEQVMVLAIFAALTSVALPTLQGTLARNQVRVAQTDFMATLQHGRATAASLGTPTVVCPSRDGMTCSETARWDEGWLMAADSDQDDQPDGAPNHVGRAYREKVIIHGTQGRPIVRFKPDGSAAGSNLTVIFCDLAGKHPALTVVVANSGRIRGATGTEQQTATCMHASE